MELDRYILRTDDYIDLIIDTHASNIHWSTNL